jgi:cytochrome c oxidase accessory protein FixG
MGSRDHVPNGTGQEARPTTSWHKLRKRIHLLCFLVFLALPFLNVVRFDIPKERFYFAGYELWINEFAIIFFAMMFLMFLVVAASVFYGRLFCGYACPQMIFSEASVALEKWLRKQVTKKFPRWKPSSRERVGRGVFYAMLAAASILLAFIFICYFVEPRDLWRRLASLDIHTAAGISGAAVTLVAFLDFTLVRQRFCTTVCPYGYLQGLLGDLNTLLVHYRDEMHECIDCKKCVRVCPMDIDIRQSPFQMECIHCAECIDACEEIMTRLNKPNLINYAWDEKGELLSDTSPRPWYRRVGLRDGKRVVVLMVLFVLRLGPFCGARDAARRAGTDRAGARHTLPHRPRWPHLQPIPLPHRQSRWQAGRGDLHDSKPARSVARHGAQSGARAAGRIRRRRVRDLAPSRPARRTRQPLHHPY